MYTITDDNAYFVITTTANDQRLIKKSEIKALASFNGSLGINLTGDLAFNKQKDVVLEFSKIDPLPSGVTTLAGLLAWVLAGSYLISEISLIETVVATGKSYLFVPTSKIRSGSLQAKITPASALSSSVLNAYMSNLDDPDIVSFDIAEWSPASTELLRSASGYNATYADPIDLPFFFDTHLVAKWICFEVDSTHGGTSPADDIDVQLYSYNEF